MLKLMTDTSNKLLESVFNFYIQLDPEIAPQFVILADKTLHIQLNDLPCQFYLSFRANRIHVAADVAQSPDACIQGTSFALMQAWQSQKQGKTEFDPSITISGDVDVVQNFTHLLQQVNIDWEAKLAKLTGGVIAHQLGNLGRSVLNWQNHVCETLAMNTTEYLQEESQLLPTRFEIEDYFHNVDKIRNDVDRFEARLQRLKKENTLEST